MDAVLRMQGISKRFGATAALQDVSFSVRKGQVHALVGENGAGKSTLMKILSGVVEPDAGKMELFGRPFHPRNPLEARRSGIAMIYQELSLVGHMSVEENVFLGMEPARAGFVQWSVLRQKTREALKALGHPEISPTAKVGGLSVGIQQIIEIARAMAVGCRILVFDEPTSSLTGEDAKRLFDVIGRLKAAGHGIVYISHFIEEIKQIADAYTVLRDGCFCGTGDVAQVSSEQMIGLMVGRKIQDLYPRGNRSRLEAALTICRRQSQPAGHETEVDLHYGEILGIAGLVGSGRSEKVRALFGLESRPSRKQTEPEAGVSCPAEGWRRGMGFLSENRKEEGLAMSLSIAENITLPNLHRYGPLGFILPGRQTGAVRKQIERLHIKCAGPRQPVYALSGGNQQKVALARLVESDSDILILDEPTRGIDVGSKALIYTILDQLVRGDERHKPKAILLVSSYLPELLGICDRIAVMYKGRLSPPLPVSRVNEHWIMRKALGMD